MEILQKEGKVYYKISGRQAVYKSNPGTVTVCRNRKKYNTSNIYTLNYTGGQFSQRGANSYWCSWGRGFGVGLRWVVGGGGGVFVWKIREKAGKGQASQLCRSYPLANYPLVSPLTPEGVQKVVPKLCVPFLAPRKKVTIPMGENRCEKYLSTIDLNQIHIPRPFLGICPIKDTHTHTRTIAWSPNPNSKTNTYT